MPEAHGGHCLYGAVANIARLGLRRSEVDNLACCVLNEKTRVENNTTCQKSREMVDTEDIFRRLTSGAKFNRQKLNKDLSFLRVS